MSSRRVLTRTVRFRIFVAALSVVYSLSFLFVVWAQSRSAARRLSLVEQRMQRRIDEACSNSVVVASGFSESVSSPVVETVVEYVDYGSSRGLPPDAPRYFVMGSGRSKQWGYLDIMFLDGFSARYFFRRDDPSSLRKMMDRLSIDDFCHRWQVALPSVGRDSVFD